MNPEPQASADDLAARLREQFEQLCKDVAAAVNSAAAGRVITDSEEEVRDLPARSRQQTYQAAVQLRLGGLQAAPPLRPTHGPASACRARAPSLSACSPSMAASPRTAAATSPATWAAPPPSTNGSTPPTPASAAAWPRWPAGSTRP